MDIIQQAFTTFTTCCIHSVIVHMTWLMFAGCCTAQQSRVSPFQSSSCRPFIQ